MHNQDLNPNLPSNSLPESPTPDVTEVATALDLESSAENSNLEQQVDAAMREVEDLLVSLPPVHVGGIDWSTPSLEHPPEEIMEPEPTDETATDVPAALPEETAIRESLRVIEEKIVEIGESRQQAESRLLVKLEAEAALQAESWARRREEEDWRRQVLDEAARRQRDDEQKLEAHREQVALTEDELRDFWSEERRIRSEIFRLNQTANELFESRLRAEEDAKLALLAEAQRSRDEADKIQEENLAKLHNEEESLRRAIARSSSRRTELEIERQRHETEARKLEEERTRLSAATSARRAETSRMRRENEEQLRLEQEQLNVQENELARLTTSLTEKRSELDAARLRAEEDSKRLSDVRERMRLSEEAAQRAEQERLQIEAEILERAEVERHLLEEARTKAEAQQRQYEAAARERHEREAQRIVELDAARVAGESQAQVFIEREQGLIAELETLAHAADTTQRRIDELQQQQATSSESHARLIERLQRVEEEAFARSNEESQARADLERRIKERIEQLRVLENGQQQRVDQEVARRTEAEKRLTELKDRYQVEQAARIKAELQFDMWSDPVPAVSAAPAPKSLVSQPVDVTDEIEQPVYQVGNLSSSDPRLRADAVTALARLGSHDAFDLIVNCFDDEANLVRNAAARAILTLEPHRPVEPLTRALKNASPEKSERIGKAIAESGLAAQALKELSNKDADGAYNSLCILFAMAKTGEVTPLVDAIEHHNDAEVRLAAVRLLKLSGQEELASEAVNRRLQPK